MGMTGFMLFLDELNDRYGISLDEFKILKGYTLGGLRRDILEQSKNAKEEEVWDYLRDWFAEKNGVPKAGIAPEMAFDWEGIFQ